MSHRVAKYFQVFQDVAKQIRRGKFLPGAPVPSENELIAAYGISNTTARKALAELERAGWVVRVKGRGTYVSDSRVDRSATRILGFTKNMLEAGRVPSTQLVSVKTRRRGRALTIGGRKYSLRGQVYEIERLRLADGIPMMRETRCVSAALCPGIDQKDLEASLYDIYEREYGLRLTRIDQSLAAVIIDGEKVDFPGVPGEIPAFCVEGVTFCGKELILEMEKSVYRGDMYRFLVRAAK